MQLNYFYIWQTNLQFRRALQKKWRSLSLYYNRQFTQRINITDSAYSEARKIARKIKTIKIGRRGAPVKLQHKAEQEGELSQENYKHKYFQVLLQYRQP